MNTLEKERRSIARAPTLREQIVNRAFRGLCYGFAALVLILVGYIVVQIAVPATPYIAENGWTFLTVPNWDSQTGQFGIAREIWGTVYSSLLALLIGGLLGLAIAIFLSEGFLSSTVFRFLKVFKVQFHPFWGNLPTKIEGLVKNLVQLLAAIPSVVYGLWGIFVMVPLIEPAADWLYEHLGFLPIFGTQFPGKSLLPSAMVLAIMILPTVAAISRDALDAVPYKIREAAFGLGATRWEAILGVFLPTAAPGIFGAILLGFGRALGETMALTMLGGGARPNEISFSLFSPVSTLASFLANKFPEANYFDRIEIGRLMYAALVLLAITLLVNVLGTLLLARAQARFKGAR